MSAPWSRATCCCARSRACRTCRSRLSEALRRTSHGVIAGLDPAIHPLCKSCFEEMDTRVKPAYDGEYVAASCFKFFFKFQTAKLPHSRGSREPEVCFGLTPK